MEVNGNNHGAASPDWEWQADFREHFFYFPEENNAKRAAERLRAKGWKVQISWSADTENWLVLATDPAPIEEELEALYHQLESLAEEFGGEYYGWGGPG